MNRSNNSRKAPTAGPAVSAVLLADSADLRAAGPGGFGGPPKGRPGGNGGPRDEGPVHDIMEKIAKGPQALSNVIGAELKETTPPWDKLKTQTKEYAELAASLGKHQPAKGSKESWAKLTAAFAASAAELSQAAPEQRQTSSVGGAAIAVQSMHVLSSSASRRAGRLRSGRRRLRRRTGRHSDPVVRKARAKDLVGSADPAASADLGAALNPAKFCRPLSRSN